ncbi:MAG: NAD(P)-dependent oxidoreductase [Lachnospiraceae bacterium]|nr:NAD(P)-dependent oxidoreductase [Lachnospiraceae bacterium]
MKVLITGANGYLGQGVVKQLLDQGHTVIATDFSTEHVDIRAERIPGDLFSIDNPYEYYGKPDVLVHLAWRDGFVHFSDAHVEDMPKHYDFIKKFVNTDISLISVMGSMHEVGFYEGCIREDTPCNPVTPYGISKNALRLLTEMLCKQSNKPFVWLRGYYIVGNNSRGSSIFAKIVAAEEAGESEFPFTKGQNQFDFLNYEDFCYYVSRAVCQTQVQGVVEICSGQPEKLADRVERFIRDNKYKVRLKYGVYPDRVYESKAVWGDRTKIDYILENCNR